VGRKMPSNCARKTLQFSNLESFQFSINEVVSSKFIYKTHYIFRKCTNVLKTRDNLKEVKFVQIRCQKFFISITNRL